MNISLLKKIALLAPLVISIVLGLPAKAAVVERTVQFDLSLLALPSYDVTYHMPVDMFSVDRGDTFIFHLGFSGGRLRFEDTTGSSLEYIRFTFPSNPVAQTGFAYNGTFVFEGVEGDLLMNNMTYGFGGPIGGFIPNANLTDTYFSFSGITYTVNIWYKQVGRPAFTSEEVDFHGVIAGQQPGVVGAIFAVPEPGTYALMLAGLAAMFGIASHRKAKQA